MVVRHPAERTEGKGRFERLAEAASNFTSSPLFHGICLVLVAFFVVTHAAGMGQTWMFLAGDLMTAVTLLLLALLKNSERRAEHAVQRKLDAIAAALLEQHEGRTVRAHDDLRRAIGMDEKV
ncbi:low affinity iron permease family protein [Streptomyces pactum]|uniref:Low affinity iron permease family protein n=1 Tax=Streptomyces pactum TaxID=68249 RepID=A0ABS0NSI4_9ACTN|nr:low affinity iron permease family protein [Streptomyces pactum]MBH5338101.1 low affinity iron permease family protein [Streptomyces pactum]